jgi:hypothetical protein
MNNTLNMNDARKNDARKNDDDAPATGDRGSSGTVITPILRNARAASGEGHGASYLSATGADTSLLARKAPVHVTMNDLHSALDHAPLYSSPAVRFRSTVATEDIGQPIYWALDAASLKHVLAHAVLLPWDESPSLAGMYQQMLVPISERVSTIVGRLQSVTDFTAEIIAELNDAIPHRRIEWIGSLRDLTHGESETARELRFRYFLATGAMQQEDAFADTPPTMPAVPTAENERFLDFLRGFPVEGGLTPGA